MSKSQKEQDCDNIYLYIEVRIYTYVRTHLYIKKPNYVIIAWQNVHIFRNTIIETEI